MKVGLGMSELVMCVRDFTFDCKWCGVTVSVVDSETQEHECRIDGCRG